MFSISFLDKLREAELATAVREFVPGARVLEFGAGTGIQAARLSDMGFEVEAIDLSSSGYAGARVFPVKDYDGKTIPLPDNSVDIVYSSNVLEHVTDFSKIAAEFRRVTRPGGYGVHLMPSVAWRAWTFAAGIPNSGVVAASAVRDLVSPPMGRSRFARLPSHAKLFAGSLLPIGHGTSFEGISELWTFSARAWRRRFEENGFEVESARPIGLFHTGHQLLGRALDIDRRIKLSAFLGSAATLYVIKRIGDGPKTH